MSLPASSPIVFCFGPFEFYPQTGELRKAGTLLKLRPQPARLLALLLSHPGELVRREQIQQAVWGEEIVVDYDLGVNRCIRQIRAVLLDNPDSPRYLKTIPRQGYVFIAAVEQMDQRKGHLWRTPDQEGEEAEHPDRPTLEPETALAPSSPSIPPLRAADLPVLPEPESIVALPALRPVQPVRSRKRQWAWVVVVCSFLLIGLGWHAVFRNGSQAPLLRTAPLTGNAGAEITPALSPDGRQIAYAWKKDGGEFDIYVKLVDLGNPLRLTSDRGHKVSPSWSPDGQRIAFLRATPSRTEIVVMPALGGAEQVVLTLRGGFDEWRQDGPRNRGKSGPVWFPDGQSLLVVDAWKPATTGLARVDLSGTHTLLTEPPSGTIDFSPSVSPDGQLIAFVRGVPGAGDLYVMSAQGGSLRRLTNDHVDISGAAWGDNHTLLFASNRNGNLALWRLTLPGTTLSATSLATGSQAETPTASARNGLIAYVTSTTQQSIWRRSLSANPASAPSQRFIYSSGRDNSPRYSPDGTQVAFVSDRSGSWEIWTCHHDGSQATRLTSFGGVPVGSPKWSPDGHALVFDAKVGAHSTIWIADARAGTTPRRLNSQEFNDILPSWSLDGRWIYFVSDRQGGQDRLWKQEVSGGQAVLVSDDLAVDATESTDGFLYYQKAEGSLWRRPIRGGVATALPELAPFRPRRNWAVTPRGIYCATPEIEGRSVFLLRFESRRLVDLGHIGQDTLDGTPGLTVSPDENWLLYVQQEPQHSNILMAHPARPGP